MWRDGARARQIGPSITTISAGGGLPIAYRPGEQLVDLEAYFRLWDAVRKRLAEAFGHPVRLEIEPGRYLVAESGYLLSQIRAVKQTSTRTFYILDAGFNNLARPILYGAYHPMSVATDNGIALERPLQDVVVAGPLCESGDVFTQQEGGVVCTRPLPVAHVGEWLVIERAGAYGFAMGSNYNSKPLAAEVLIVDKNPYLVRPANVRRLDPRREHSGLHRGPRLIKPIVIVVSVATAKGRAWISASSRKPRLPSTRRADRHVPSFTIVI